MGIISGLQYGMGWTLRSARQSVIRASFNTPKLGAFEAHIVESLCTVGAVVSSVEELAAAGFIDAPKIMEYGARLFEGVERITRRRHPAIPVRTTVRPRAMSAMCPWSAS